MEVHPPEDSGGKEAWEYRRYYASWTPEEAGDASSILIIV